MTSAAPIEHFYDLTRLSNAGDDVIVSAKAEELKRLAQWFDVASVQKFEGRISLTKFAADRYRYEAALICDLTQHSVVSLEPVRTHVEETFRRDLHVAPRGRRTEDSEPTTLAIAVGEEDGPEELDSPHFDLAAPLLEELSLSLDPYPKAPGEALAAPEGLANPVESPFAVLRRLKDGG